eukprot:TRINITY_DN1737_c0_g1_i1.p1 TRINITY_DN1737_c0_g1~~TRINITY_DN1737_c0_g1_i1.p1  ORF type:complete len:385 (+),score=38.84 TRINITY_DN1737_c0_g1_i1:406-1560(+)
MKLPTCFVCPCCKKNCLACLAFSGPCRYLTLRASSVLVENLKSHVKKCPGRNRVSAKTSTYTFYVADINSNAARGTACPAPAVLSSNDDQAGDAKKSMCAKIVSVWNECSPSCTAFPVQVAHLHHQGLEATDKEYPQSRKHSPQLSSIVAHMQELNVLQATPGHGPRCYLEIGAGKAKLTHALTQVTDAANASFIIVDYSRFRHTAEKQHTMKGDLISRLTIDVKDLDLSLVPQASRADLVVAYGKHVCGGATDFMLRCMINFVEKMRGRAVPANCPAVCIALALCCFHRCTWDAYLDKDFLTSHGIGEENFKTMAQIASWRTCALDAGAADVGDKVGAATTVRDLLLLGRVKALEQAGWHVRLVEYVDKTVSPENILLLATYP